MQSSEFMGAEAAINAELEELAASLRNRKTNGNGNGHRAADLSKKAGTEKGKPSGVKSER
jgi:hypothetical protein